eukprot:609684-Rhodomonas_salina.1
MACTCACSVSGWWRTSMREEEREERSGRVMGSPVGRAVRDALAAEVGGQEGRPAAASDASAQAQTNRGPGQQKQKLESFCVWVGWCVCGVRVRVRVALLLFSSASSSAGSEGSERKMTHGSWTVMLWQSVVCVWCALERALWREERRREERRGKERRGA